MVDQPGLPGGRRSLGQLSVSAEHVDERGLAHIRPSDEGEFGQFARRLVADPGTAACKSGIADRHPWALPFYCGTNIGKNTHFAEKTIPLWKSGGRPARPLHRLRRADVRPRRRPLAQPRPAGREVLRDQPVCLLRKQSGELH